MVNGTHLQPEQLELDGEKSAILDFLELKAHSQLFLIKSHFHVLHLLMYIAFCKKLIDYVVMTQV